MCTLSSNRSRLTSSRFGLSVHVLLNVSKREATAVRYATQIDESESHLTRNYMSPPAHLLSVNHLHHQIREKFTVPLRPPSTHLTNTPNNPSDNIENQRKRNNYNSHNESHQQHQSVSHRRRGGGRRRDADSFARRIIR